MNLDSALMIAGAIILIALSIWIFVDGIPDAREFRMSCIAKGGTVIRYTSHEGYWRYGCFKMEKILE